MIVKWQPSWIRHPGYLDFPRLTESAEIERKVITTNARKPVCAKNIKVIGRKNILRLFAMATSKSMNSKGQHHFLQINFLKRL